MSSWRRGHLCTGRRATTARRLCHPHRRRRRHRRHQGRRCTRSEASKVSSITVQGAGTSAANGAYKKTEGASDGEPIFALDSGHELYRYGGRWRLGEQGHGLTYGSLMANADGPPASKGWAVAAQGTAPTPVFSC